MSNVVSRGRTFRLELLVVISLLCSLLLASCFSPPPDNSLPREIEFRQLSLGAGSISIFAPLSMLESNSGQDDEKIYLFRNNDIEYILHVKTISEEDYKNGSYFSPDIKKHRLTDMLNKRLEERNCQITHARSLDIAGKYEGRAVEASCRMAGVNSSTRARICMIDRAIYSMEVIVKNDKPFPDEADKFLDSLEVKETAGKANN